MPVSQVKLSEGLEAYLEGYRTSITGKMEGGETGLERWREGVRDVEDIYDVSVRASEVLSLHSQRKQAAAASELYVVGTVGPED